MKRPYVLIKFAISEDGYLDDSNPQRLILSNKEDLEVVNNLRTKFDAILVGANTIRKDKPLLSLKSMNYKGNQIVPVVITNSGDLDPNTPVFQLSERECLIYSSKDAYESLKKIMPENVTVVSLDGNSIEKILDDLSARGVQRLLVEGGAKILEEFISGEYYDEIRIAVSPVVIGQKEAPYFKFFNRLDCPLVSEASLAGMKIKCYKNPMFKGKSIISC